MYTLHTTSCIHQSGAGAGRQTWKAHSYRSICSALDRRRREGRSAEEWGALSERSFQCGASPSVCWQDARAKATHTHTQTGMSVCKQDTLLTWGSSLKLIAQTQCVQVCVEKKVSQWGEEGRRGGRVERFLNEAA